MSSSPAIALGDIYNMVPSVVSGYAPTSTTRSKTISREEIKHDLVAGGGIFMQCKPVADSWLDVSFDSRSFRIHFRLYLRQVECSFTIAVADAGIIFSEEELQYHLLADRSFDKDKSHETYL